MDQKQLIIIAALCLCVTCILSSSSIAGGWFTQQSTKTDETPTKTDETPTKTDETPTKTDETPTAFKLNNTKSTNRSNMGGIDTLTSHPIDCGNTALNSMKLVNDVNGQMHYEYGCSSGGDIISNTKYSNENAQFANNNVVFLDRLNVKCAANEVLSNVQLKTQDNTMKYDYNCLKSKNNLKCDNRSTSFEHNSKTVDVLDRIPIKCNDDEVLSGFKLVPNGTNNKYDYTCCKI